MQNKTTRILVTVFGGIFGIHKFIDKQIGAGILYLLTGGLFGIGWIIDIIKAFASPTYSSPHVLNSTQEYTASEIIPENSNICFHNDFLIVGVGYECLKNNRINRSDVIKNTNLTTPVRIEQYLYKGSPAYMVVNSVSNLDLGVLSSGAASWLTDYYSNGTCIATLVDKFENSFHVRIIVYN